MLSHIEELRATTGPCVGNDVLPQRASKLLSAPSGPSRKAAHASPTSNNVRAQLLLEVALEYGLKFSNTFGNPETPFWTHIWKANSNLRSQIDFLLVPKGLNSKAF
eukprot:807987-Heterocapsa_arctica.AAC.1